jgi:3-phenylpropionate/trans-cinnamate dioxygenase ferredoxin reductase subunit
MSEPATLPAMVIVGAGEAGARAAMTLREQGWTGPVTLIGDEAGMPYERPPLSKAVMVAEADPTAAPFILDESRLRDADITHLGGCTVVSIDRDRHRVILGNGREVSYGKLLLATGATARQLALPGASPEDVLYLRKFADALLMRSRLRPNARLVVIGGGFIGLEIAASAVERKCSVTLIEMAPRLLMRGVPAPVAELVAKRHEAAGVDLRLGASIERIERNGAEHTVVLADGSRIVCDGIIAGVGAIPEVTLARDAGLAIENGIRTDNRLRTSDPGIFAAGDCCSFPHPLYNDRLIRLEAWRNAQDQGALAARNMLGADLAYDTVPWFWSDQYDQTLQIAGLPDEGRNSVNRDLGDGAQLYFHLADDGRLVGASGVGPISKVAKNIRLAEMLIQRRVKPSEGALADPSVGLKSLLKN